MLNQIKKDPFIPVILVLTFMLSIMITSFVRGKIYKPLQYKNSSNVLGLSTFHPLPPDCRPGSCGFCANCGSNPGISCGSLSRCSQKDENYYCRFDFNCQ
ncbi:hypothetical protein A3E42_05560 [Candidatus Gottesmanbacteria bacterium RIFCSPHIGHO2_12_FULL_40_13]|nr:MAG: hypothetical protein A3E42_05560 [Candidatus Gottesmanbacteria bacterium RIFCSPHIGHO2_12_FULL_40_13]